MIRFALLLAALAGTASAQTPELHSIEGAIVVSPPTDPCVNAASIAQRVTELIGTSEVDAAIAIGVELEGDTELTFVVHRHGEEIGRRSFDVLPLECGARVAAVGLAIALAIDHTLLERLAAEEPAPPPEPAPPAPPSGPRLALEADAALLAGVLHQPAFGGALAAELAIDPLISLRLRALAVYALPSTFDTSGSFESLLAAAQLAGCLAWRADRVALGGCGGIAVGVFRAAGIDFAPNREHYAPWLALSLEAFLAVTVIDPVAIRVGLEGDVSLIVPTVLVLNAEGAVRERAEALPAGATVTVGVLFWL